MSATVFMIEAVRLVELIVVVVVVVESDVTDSSKSGVQVKSNSMNDALSLLCNVCANQINKGRLLRAYPLTF